MATRSRTILFLQYRNSFGRAGPKPLLGGGGLGGEAGTTFRSSSERAGLIANAVAQDTIIEMSALPPKWVDVVDEVDEIVEQTKAKISKLAGMHKKHLLPGFDDRSVDEASIEALTDEITSSFHECQKRIKDIGSRAQTSSYTPQELKMCKNVQTSLGSKVQELLTSFRKSQADYLKKMGGNEAGTSRAKNLFKLAMEDDDDDPDFDIGFTDQQLSQVASNEAAITQREREINEIAKSIFQVAEIFKDMQTLVIDQGTLLDRIDYNIEQVHVHVQGAVKELEEGTKYQKSARNKMCMLLLILVIFGLLIVLVRRLTKISVYGSSGPPFGSTRTASAALDPPGGQAFHSNGCLFPSCAQFFKLTKR